MVDVRSILSGQDPTQVFRKLKADPQKTTQEKRDLLTNLILCWEFFEKERLAGKLHYRPNDPEDVLGITSTIEASHKVLSKTTCLQFNARSMEHTFTLSFRNHEMTKNEAYSILRANIIYNKDRLYTPDLAVKKGAGFLR